MKILVSVLVTLISLMVIFLIIIYSGWYNVSAMNEEGGIMKWVLNTTKQNSIEARLDNISLPDLNNHEMISEGFEHYNEMCVSCHGAPGKEETELSKGLNPPAPYLVEHAEEMDPRELFWVTKNGINMTGMPAWGKTHSDEKIWAIVAFMKKLPNLTAEDYEKMESDTGTVDDDQENTNVYMDREELHNKEEHHH